jgi:hypothetical protein
LLSLPIRNVFYAVNPVGELIPLDQETLTDFHTKTRALPGYASVKTMAELKPGHSSVRLNANLQFIVRGRASLDPNSRYELRQLKTDKSERESEMGRAHGTLMGGSASTLDKNAIPIRVEEYGSDSYRITPERPVAPGEYGLGLRGVVAELYCFGVDR